MTTRGLTLLTDATSEPLAGAIRTAAARWGVHVSVTPGRFGAPIQDILDPSSDLYRSEPDYVVLAMTPASLPKMPSIGSSVGDVHALVERTADQHAQWWERIHGHLDAQVIQQTYVPQSHRFTGPAEANQPWARRRYLEGLNEALAERTPSHVHLVDTAAAAADVGYDRWNDPRGWHLGRLSVNPAFLDDYGRLIAGTIAALEGLSKKCLVVDLDNTLWKGVVGDDGLDGIEIGPGTAAGEAHLEFCRYLIELRARGTLLAVCSKNDPETAREVFERHPGMPLRFSDFSSFVCRWEDKASSIAQIASELNFSRSHLAFVDDNPSECAHVSRAFPEIEVMCLDGDPSLFSRRVDRTGWFSAVRLTAEDFERAERYEVIKRATTVESGAATLDEHLRELAMQGNMATAGPPDIPRLVQLEARTNQFNLTTRRLTDSDFRAALESADTTVLTCRLSDRFGDHGLVSALVVERASGDLRVRSWVMSCRVFSRTLEAFILNYLTGLAQASGLRQIAVDFTPTDRNGIAAETLRKLGFVENPGPRGWWYLTVPDVPFQTFVNTLS